MRTSVIVAAGLALLVTAMASLAAPVAKPTQKPRNVAPNAGQGTAQLPGDNGVFGVTYSLGKGDAALYFTLLSAQYTVTRAALKMPALPAAGEKLLVLRYTIQNPSKRESGIAWSSFGFTAVDSENVNRPSGQDWSVLEPQSGACYYVNLKPAQKIDALCVIKIPAGNSVPKLMVERGTGNPVLRYYFDAAHPKNVIQGLAAPFADPADPTGARALAEVPAQRETYYPLRAFDLKLVSAGFEAAPITGVRPNANERVFVAAITFKNATLQRQGQSWHSFSAELKTDDGEKTKNQVLYKLKRDESINGTQEPGEEYSARLIFRIPKNVSATQLTISEGDSRRLVFDVSDVK